MASSKQEDLFRNFFGRAVYMSTNITFLEGVLKPVLHGDWEYLKPMLGEHVSMSPNDSFTTEAGISVHLITGVSILRAFQAELCLKALLVSEDKRPPREHDLLLLHDELNPKSQGKLEDLFRERSESQAKKGFAYIQMPSFRSVMERSRNDFIHVRYDETFEEFLDRIRGGLSNLSEAVTAAMAVCLLHPWAEEWYNHVSMLGDAPSADADS